MLSIEFIPKIEPKTSELLSLIYTPGVGAACMEIKEDKEKSYIYTNRSNSVAVISYDFEKSLKRATFLKNTLNIDAYPFSIRDNLELVVKNITPNFCGIDLTLISGEVKDIDFRVDIPILKESGVNIEETFKPVSKNVFMFNPSNLEGTLQEKALHLREAAGGVVETVLREEESKRPVAIVSDGSAVLGFGNIGADAGLPVMEGKAVLFKALGNVDAISLCLKTQNSDEIVKIVQSLQGSFSGVNLEDIGAPRCFDIENALIETLEIPVFHDDQHGTAIVVLAGVLNALSLIKKNLSEIKITISGAGAAAQAVSRLLFKAGAANIIHADRQGIVYSGREDNDDSLERLSRFTNKSALKGGLKEALAGADIFIGLSAAGVLKPEFIKEMNENPIIFALSNPTPEIMPEEAFGAGAYIVATGRSDFPNQINNALAFPGLFEGILAHGIHKITDEMKIDCAIAIASIIKDDELTVTNILPNALDLRVPNTIVERLQYFK